MKTQKHLVVGKLLCPKFALSVQKQFYPTIQTLVFCIALFLSSRAAHSANYYWRATPVNDDFTNVGNWETAPGNLTSPPIAPTINDDVFFPVASSMNTIRLNAGYCRDFTVSAASSTTFTFTGFLTTINGSLECTNGNAYFNLSGTTTFRGSGSHTINLGTTQQRIDIAPSAILVFQNASNSGTYTLTNAFNSRGIFIQVVSQNFVTNNFPLTTAAISIEGNTSKTIDFGNSTITLSTTSGTQNMLNLLSSHTTTTYNTVNSNLIFNNNATVSLNAEISAIPGLNISFNKVRFNMPNSGPNHSLRSRIGTNAGSAFVLNIDTFTLNVHDLTFGVGGFGGVAADNFTVNTNHLEILNPVIIHSNAASVNLNIGGLTEPNLCQGQTLFNSRNSGFINLNPTIPLTTTSIAYRGVRFGGSGVTATNSFNLGFNTGNVTWSAALPSTTYYWVGGNGDWEDPTQWSITGSGGAPQSSTGCIPTFADDVIIDANSFSGTQSIFIRFKPAFCRNLSWLGSNQGELAIPNNVRYLCVAGNFNVSGARAIGPYLIFLGTGNHTITSGSTMVYGSPVIALEQSGTYTLTDNLTTQGLCYLQQFSGTFNSNGRNIDVGLFGSHFYPKMSSNIRNINFSNSTITYRWTQVVWTTIDFSNFGTFNCTNNLIEAPNPGALFVYQILDHRNYPYPTVVNFNNFNFSSNSSGGQQLQVRFDSLWQVNFNVITCNANCIFNNTNGTVTFAIDSLNTTPNYTYSFGTGGPITILSSINKIFTLCEEAIRIQSTIPGTRARIFKSALPFTINGALINDIHSTGATLTINSGLDLGNNLNVVINNGSGRKMYWVRNTGNWSDGGKWSIGVSGGNPLTTNPGSCLPRPFDDVIFDGNSFNTSNPSVTLDIDGNARSMVWLPVVNAFNPNFIHSGALRRLSLYDSLELQRNVTFNIGNNSLRMEGRDTAVNSNSIDLNGAIITAYVSFNGNGRYDLIDSFSSNRGLEQVRGKFYTNGNRMRLGGMYLRPNVYSNYVDISNSFITLFDNQTPSTNAYRAEHSNVNQFNGSNSTLFLQNLATNIVVINNIPINYHRFILNSSYSFTNYVESGNRINLNALIFKKVSSPTSLIRGIVHTDTLEYPISSVNEIQSGGTSRVVVNDSLKIYGTPCIPAVIRGTSIGSQARLDIADCNMNLNFVNFRDINLFTCTTPQNKTIGTNEGNVNNITFKSIADLTRLGNDTSLNCRQVPYIQGTSGFGSIPGISYKWQDSSTNNTFSANVSTNLFVRVNYAAGCFLTDTKVVNVGPAPPITVPLGFLQQRTDSCLITGYRYYEGNASSSTANRSIIAINPNGNSWNYSSITVNHQGNLTGGSGTFSNSGAGFYQSTDGTNSIRVSKRLHSIVAPGAYSTNGGVRVRVYYEAVDTTAMISTPLPGGATIQTKGWFKHSGSTAQNVINDMIPGYINNCSVITPIAQGIESGVLYAEFLLPSFSSLGFYVNTSAVPLNVNQQWLVLNQKNCKELTFDVNIQNSVESFRIFGIQKSGNRFLIQESMHPEIKQYSFTINNEAKKFIQVEYNLINQNSPMIVKSIPVTQLNCTAEISVKPNPAGGFFEFSGLEKETQYSVIITDKVGKIILQNNTISNLQNKIGVQHLSTGLYHVHIQNQLGNMQTFPLIKR